MQMQPFQPRDLATAQAPGADRIQVPGVAGQAVTLAGPRPPSLLQVFGREIWKRKKLLGVWVAVTIVLAGVVVTTFARPVYRAEGRLSYRPNYGASGPRPIYTPPNIQSAVQILKASDVFEPVRVKHLPGVSPDEFSRNVRVEMSRQSEFIDVSYDHPNPAVAAAVANDLMAEGLKYFTDVRAKSTKDAVVQVRHDLATAKQKLEDAKKELADAYRDKDIANPEVELDNLKSALGEIGGSLRIAKERLASLKLEIDYLEAKRDAPPDVNDTAIDEQFFSLLSARLSDLQNKMTDKQTVGTAKALLDNLRLEERRMRVAVDKGIYPAAEYDALLTKIKIQEDILKGVEDTRQERELLAKQLEELKAKTKGGKRTPRALQDDLDRLKKEAAVLPAKIRFLEQDQREKKKALSGLVQLGQELGPRDEEIRLLRTQVQEHHAQLSAASGRSLDPHGNDLRVQSTAVPGTSPYSTNAPKLGMALAGASALLFIGYISLFGLPKGTFTGPNAAGGLANAPAPGGGILPRALVALIPYTQKANADGGQAGLNGTAVDAMSPTSPPATSTEAAAPMDRPGIADPMTADLAPLADPADDAEPVAVAEPEPVRALAQRMVDEGVDRGGIVLFSPTDEELLLAPAIGDLGRFFTERGERVLVFDARQAAENPAWVQAPGVAASVEGFLKGQGPESPGCFVPTSLQGVEYSRVDLSNRVSGVLEQKRFQELVEQMRARYSVVFLVGPPVTLDEDHPLLATLAEGMVLVTETAADPVEVHAYLDTLCQQFPARLYGTLAVPKTTA